VPTRALRAAQLPASALARNLLTVDVNRRVCLCGTMTADRRRHDKLVMIAAGVGVTPWRSPGSHHPADCVQNCCSALHIGDAAECLPRSQCRGILVAASHDSARRVEVLAAFAAPRSLGGGVEWPK
jgi:hypothetical protein